MRPPNSLPSECVNCVNTRWPLFVCLPVADTVPEGQCPPPAEQPAINPVQLRAATDSGEADALTGRFLSVFHDLGHLIAEAETIRRNGLYTLRIGHLEETEPA